MDVIVELVNRAHKVIEHHRFQGASCRIGRAYDNDLILSEAHVSPHHARLREDEEGVLWLDDLASDNGVMSRHHKRLVTPVQVRSGDEFILGKVHLKFYARDHQVDDAVGLGMDENLIYTLSQPLHFILFATLSISFFLALEYMQTYNELEMREFLPRGLSAPSIGLLWAGIWALAGRILRHEPRFVSQYIITLVFLICMQVVEVLLGTLAFNSGDYTLTISQRYPVHAVLFAVLLSYNLRLASHQSKRNRLITANSISWGLVGLIWLVSVYSQPPFSNQPKYVSALQPPIMRWKKGVTVEQFQHDAMIIFDVSLEKKE